MKKEKQSNRSLIISILSIITCVVLLIGATMAWFTDTETNTGNRIEAGTLDAKLYKWTGDGTVDEISDGDWTQITNETADNFIFGGLFENWQPGDTETIYLAVENAGSLDFDYNLDLVVEDESLADALQFKVVSAKSSIPTLDDEKYTTVSSVIEDKIVSAAPNGNLGSTEIEYIALTITLDESTGNTYQGDAFKMDLILTATQENQDDTVVKAYDIEDVVSAEDSQTVILMNDIDGTGTDLSYDYPVNFDFNGYILTVDSFSMVSEDYCTVDFADSTVIVKGNVYIDIANGTLTLDDCIYNLSGTATINVSEHTLNINGSSNFYELDGTTKVVVTIMDDSYVVTDTDSKVWLQGELGATNILVEDPTTGSTESLTEDATEFAASTVVTTELEFLNAVISRDKMSLSEDLSINTSNIYGYGSNYYYVVSFLQSFGVDIDLNGYTLTITSPSYSMGVYEGKSYSFSNGNLEVVYGTGASSASGVFVTYENAELNLTDVDYTTNGCGILASGPDATVNITNSSITAPWYCLGTNATATDGVVASQGLVMNYTGSTFTTTEAGGIPVFLNVPGVLTMDDCVVNSEDTGVLVRGGTAYISDTIVNSTYDYEVDEDGNYYYTESNWEGGTGVPFAGIVLGNRGGSGSYAYDTVCSLENVTINLDGDESDYAVYVWGHNGTDTIEGGDITLDFNYVDCTFDGQIYVGGSNVTINNASVETISQATVAGTYTYDGTYTQPTDSGSTVSLYSADTATGDTSVATPTAVTTSEVVTYIEGEEIYIAE